MTWYPLQCFFNISSVTVRRWVEDFEENLGKFSESKKGKFEKRWILNQEDLKNKAVDFLKHFPNPKPGENNEQLRDITVEDFQTFLNDDLLPNSGLDLKQTHALSIPISWDTARLWMHGLGFGFSDVKKDIYHDGHDREDVVQHRVGLIDKYFEWADFLNKFVVMIIGAITLFTPRKLMPKDFLL